MITTADRTSLVWHWCRDAYLRIGGRCLELPKDTDPHKTYQWRYLCALDKKLAEWGFDNDLARAFIDTAVRYAVRRKLLSKGLSIFGQKNLLDECHKELCAASRKQDDVVTILGRTRKWLGDMATEHGISDLTGLLLRRRAIGSHTNLVRWYQGGDLPEVYLAISRSCGSALVQLATSDKVERSVLPADMRLYLVRTAVLRDALVKFEVRNLLKDDWRKQCPS